MEAVAFALMQDRLSTEGSFILCDAMAEGFPIRYASRGFVELFGYNKMECNGKKCGVLVGGPSITAHDFAVVAKTNGLSPDEVKEANDFLNNRARAECEAMMAKPGERMGFILALNRKKSGQLFVCEVLMFVMEHPVVGWPYSIGLQRDVTAEVPVGTLLLAASEARFPALARSREAPARERVATLRMEEGPTREFFHSKSLEMWEEMMRMVSEAQGDLKVEALGNSTVALSTSAGSEVLEEDLESSAPTTFVPPEASQRVCLHVRNLPATATAQQLRGLFEPCGAVLDVDVKLDESGRCRGFGFVVVPSMEEATKAVAEVGDSALGGNRLSVAVGAISDAPAPEPFWPPLCGGGAASEPFLPLSSGVALAAFACGSAWPTIGAFAQRALRAA